MNCSAKERKPMGTAPEIVARLRPLESDLARLDHLRGARAEDPTALFVA